MDTRQSEFFVIVATDLMNVTAIKFYWRKISDFTIKNFLFCFAVIVILPLWPCIRSL